MLNAFVVREALLGGGRVFAEHELLAENKTGKRDIRHASPHLHGSTYDQSFLDSDQTRLNRKFSSFRQTAVATGKAFLRATGLEIMRVALRPLNGPEARLYWRNT